MESWQEIKDPNQLQLLDLRQILLFIGSVSINDDLKVSTIVNDLGFTSNILIYGSQAMATKNLYGGFFTELPNEDIIWSLKEKLYAMCKDANVGMVDFFLIDATESAMFKSIWHDGFY